MPLSPCGPCSRLSASAWEQAGRGLPLEHPGIITIASMMPPPHTPSEQVKGWEVTYDACQASILHREIV
ncbi:hypothetical protein CERSUDRAFT_78969 [Gelatoporia subvermispora B]|uniref:Uncharacterized protein n=1 Tax=Ceriporiopsis subvermispora (strain B) TaxID=914234 RepID=M2RS94_CERS8|nr:hypothetical protein CERSUDRAFT_78969 [Gelatoporia subvermispora B]